MSLGPAVLQPQLFLGEAGRRNSVEGSNAPLVEHVGFSVLQAVMYAMCSWAGVLKWRPRLQGNVTMCSWAGVLKWRPHLQGNACSSAVSRYRGPGLLRCAGALSWSCAV